MGVRSIVEVACDLEHVVLDFKLAGIAPVMISPIEPSKSIEVIDHSLATKPYIIKTVGEKPSSKEITIKIYSHGIGAQGIELGSALKAGVDYEIIGVGGAEAWRAVIEFILV